MQTFLQNNEIMQEVTVGNADSEDDGRNQEHKSSKEYAEEGLGESGEAFAEHLSPVRTNNKKWREEKKTRRKRQDRVQPKRKDLEVSMHLHIRIDNNP